MSDAALERIADALERMAPPPAPAADPKAHAAYRWDGDTLHAASGFAPLPVTLLTGIDRQKAAAMQNIRRHADGAAAHDMLLWGARGMGKSALVKLAVASLQDHSAAIALVEAPAAQLDTLPKLFTLLSQADRRFLVFIDDIGFESANAEARSLRSMLEGGAEERPGNIRLAVTSNRRNILERVHGNDADLPGGRDERDDALALADRFGIKLGFQYPDQETWLAMVAAYVAHFDLAWETEDALAFAHGRGGRSGRIAWHYAVELAGRAGKNI